MCNKYAVSIFVYYGKIKFLGETKKNLFEKDNSTLYTHTEPRPWLTILQQYVSAHPLGENVKNLSLCFLGFYSMNNEDDARM